MKRYWKRLHSVLVEDLIYPSKIELANVSVKPFVQKWWAKREMLFNWTVFYWCFHLCGCTYNWREERETVKGTGVKVPQSQSFPSVYLHCTGMELLHHDVHGLYGPHLSLGGNTSIPQHPDRGYWRKMREVKWDCHQGDIPTGINSGLFSSLQIIFL